MHSYHNKIDLQQPKFVRSSQSISESDSAVWCYILLCKTEHECNDEIFCAVLFNMKSFFLLAFNTAKARQLAILESNFCCQYYFVVFCIISFSIFALKIKLPLSCIVGTLLTFLTKGCGRVFELQWIERVFKRQWIERVFKLQWISCVRTPAVVTLSYNVKFLLL